MFTVRGVRDKPLLHPTLQTGTLRVRAHPWCTRFGPARLADEKERDVGKKVGPGDGYGREYCRQIRAMSHIAWTPCHGLTLEPGTSIQVISGSS